METFKKTLDELIPKLNNEIDTLHGEAIDDIFLSGDANMYEVLNKIDGIEAKFKELEERSSKYNTWQEVLQTSPTMFENLDQLREDFNLRALMWRSLKQWEELTEGWAKQKFDSIDAKSIQVQADKFAKICSRVEKNLPENPIGTKLKDLVDTFKGAMPIVVALRNDNLKEHHWGEIKSLIN
ncbi:hypothetical protein COB52_05615 [Candidatus Kaiserbacteria bacterium]|nr:MAG: hypothetical protein COB52_05615 [Candidatus Kaiserbacteria bacterium]